MKIPQNHIQQLISKDLLNVIFEVEESTPQQIMLIGGVVRDYFLKRSHKKDVDLVTDGDGILLAKQIAEKLNPSPKVEVFKNFGTAMFFYQGIQYEFVGSRKESYREKSRNPIVSKGTLKDDQLRRDFTINALGISLNLISLGDVSDPFEGMTDLKSKLIRTPLDAQSTFNDDPLRIFRAIRFAAQLGFEIDENVLKTIPNLLDRIEILSVERITDELHKIMATNRPSVGLLLLEQTGIMQRILPEVSALKGVDEQEGQTHKDNFYHTLEVVDNVASRSENLWLRWAALLHDIGKPPTKKFVKPTGWTFHNHELVGSKMTKRIFKRLKISQGDKLRYVQDMVFQSSRPVSLANENCTDSAVRRLVFEMEDNLDDLFHLCYSDITTKNPKRKAKYYDNLSRLQKRIEEVEAKDQIRNWKNPISGELIMNTFAIKPSKVIGDIKDEIKEAVLEGTITNDYDEAYQLMLSIGKKLDLPLK